MYFKPLVKYVELPVTAGLSGQDQNTNQFFKDINVTTNKSVILLVFQQTRFNPFNLNQLRRPAAIMALLIETIPNLRLTTNTN